VTTTIQNFTVMKVHRGQSLNCPVRSALRSASWSILEFQIRTRDGRKGSNGTNRTKLWHYFSVMEVLRGQ